MSFLSPDTVIQRQGRTRWTRFAAVLTLGLLAPGALIVALAHGAIGA